MKKVYVYEYCHGLDLFLVDHELSEEESYCPSCDYHHTLKAVTSNVNDMLELFPEYGYPEATKEEFIGLFNEIQAGRRKSSLGDSENEDDNNR